MTAVKIRWTRAFFKSTADRRLYRRALHRVSTGSAGNPSRHYPPRSLAASIFADSEDRQQIEFPADTSVQCTFERDIPPESRAGIPLKRL